MTAKKVDRPRLAVRARWPLAAIAVVALAGGALWRFGDPRAVPGGEDGGIDGEQADSGPRADYRVGDVITYALSYEAAVDLSEGGRYYQLAAKGEWTLTVLEVSKDGVLLSASVAGAKLTSSNARPTQAEEYRGVEQSLVEPFFIKLDRRGAAQELRLGPKATTAAAQVQRAVVALSQVVMPDAVTSRWLPIEADPSGKYLAEYQRIDAQRISKRKLNYTELSSAGSVAPGAQIEVKSSEGELVLDERNLLQDLRVRDATTTTTQLMPAMIGTTMLQLKRKSLVSRQDLVAALRDRAARLTPLAIDAPYVGADIEAAVDGQKIAGRKLADFMSDWRTLPRAGDENPEQRDKSRRLFVEFAALLRNDDSAVDEVLADILAGDPMASTLWDALAAAGSPRAQDALRQLIVDPGFNEHDHRLQLVGLSFVARPTPETVQFLVDKVDDPNHAQQARFGIGTAANHLAASDAERAESGLRTLMQKLDQAEQPSDKSDYLRAIGNAANPKSEPLIEGYLEHEEAPVRAAAAAALRFMTGDDVSAKLAKLIKSDPDSFVRTEAIAAAGLRTPDRLLLDAVYDASRGDPVKGPRERATAALGYWRRSDPSIDRALTEFEQSEMQAQQSTP